MMFDCIASTSVVDHWIFICKCLYKNSLVVYTAMMLGGVLDMMQARLSTCCNAVSSLLGSTLCAIEKYESSAY